MTIIEKATVKSYHQHRCRQGHYSDAQKQGWSSEEVQQLRFSVFSRLIDFNDKAVLDVGCGIGDFIAFLDQHFSRFDYIVVP